MNRAKERVHRPPPKEVEEPARDVLSRFGRKVDTRTSLQSTSHAKSRLEASGRKIVHIEEADESEDFSLSTRRRFSGPEIKEKY